jgi:hypothetical protein
MKCNEFIKMIPKFVNDTMEIEYYDEFIGHVKNCKDCKEDLEINYMIQVGLNRIEDDSTKSFDIRGEMERQLIRYEEKADIIYKRKVYKKVTIATAEICAVIISVVQLMMIWYG